MQPNTFEEGRKEGSTSCIQLCREEEKQSHIVNLLFQPGLDQVLDLKFCSIAGSQSTDDTSSFIEMSEAWARPQLTYLTFIPDPDFDSYRY